MAVAADAPRLVVLRALGLGDLLTAVPALRGLRRAFRQHRIVLAAPAVLAPVAELTGAVDDIVDVPFRAGIDGTSGTVGASLPPALAAPEVTVNLHGRGPQSHRLLLQLRPRRLIAFRHPAVPHVSGPTWDDEQHEVQRWCRLVGDAADPRDLDLPVDPRDGPAAARAATLLHPGAASGARRWPVERWVALARALRARRGAVVVTGGAAEVDLARSVAEGAGLDDAAVLAGRTDLRSLLATVAAARQVVCGDTGIAHVATAVGTPSVVLFGPTPPARWGPPPDRPQHRALWAGRTGDPHAGDPASGLLAISVDQVLDAVEQPATTSEA